MKPKVFLFVLFLFTFFLFVAFSYTVAKEMWVKIDFDTTVRLQDHIPRKFDEYFSFLSVLGSAEITVGFCVLMAFLSLIRFRWLSILGWLMVVPATFLEVFGKLVLFHPAPPIFLNRTNVFTHLPSFYVHTDFSYPSGHMTRTIFITTIFFCLAIFYLKQHALKLFTILTLLGFSILMGLTRVYLGEHWTSDVIGGGLLGASIGFFASILILRESRRRREEPKD